MNKKRNTVLFLIGATIFNIIVFFAVFIALMALFILVISPYILSNDGLSGVATPFIVFLFALSIIVSFVIYRGVITHIFYKYEMDAYFAPIFVPSRKKQRKKN